MISKYIYILISFLVIPLSYCIAQQNVVVNGHTFNSNLEVATAQISNETIMLELYEIDKINSKYQTDNCSDCPDGKSLILDVDLKRNFKFPIEATDSVFIRVSNLQDSFSEYNHNISEMNKAENSRNIPEEQQLKNNAEVIKAKGIEIAKLMQQGKITPEEAEKQLLALTQSYNEDLEASSTINNQVEEYQSKANYSFSFYNDETLTETEPYSGYLYIKEFSNKRFVAEYRGEVIEQCVEKRAASSQEAEEKCKSKVSQFLPETKVLEEGSGSFSVSIDIKEFLNNR